MKCFKIILFILLPLCLMGCPDKDDEMDSEITIINRSNQSLIMDADIENYPDTSIWLGSNPFDEIVRSRFTIKPNSVYKQKLNWKKVFSSKNSTGVMLIYLYDTAILDTVSWDKIREDYLIAKRYEYTLKQLDSLNWTIIYP